ncbi:N-acetylmuramoyl-L-alanine amidase [Clostridium cylindrosporum]|uniref:SpoIID/LytB domain protein n=1 Tax=Clostridium cylindrosporum DSM 605 TaxID=1121307 RepID=A0A0J8G590_CLOCY|nr:N-acetylmuramoyl-L-alanine amidase [Clostridium cylindrosporum]KMT22826.1 SpoIID/LytB domain protein [Clostridium cylindrosporum DSM 605]
MEFVKANIILDNKETVIDVEQATIYAMCDVEIKDIEYEVLKALVVLKRSEISKKVKNTPYFEKNHEISIKKRKVRKSIKKAVEETRGEVVLSNGRLVEMYYTMCCSGATSNSEDVIGEKINFLRKIYCDKCSKKESYRKFSLIDYEEKTGRCSSFKEESQSVFSSVVRDTSGRVKSLNFLGDEVSGIEFMKRLNLKSNKMYFKDEVINIKVEGEGDGLGICIEGAKALARDGKDYREIINYYYTGISFEVLGGESSNTLSGKVFLLDPGHGGEDRGNVRGDIVESEIALEVALELKSLLEGKRAKVHLTRARDSSITLTDRAEMANNIKPDFLISIHLNAFIMPGVNGCEAYCYEKDKEAMEVSELILDEIENTVDIKKRKVNIGDYFILRESRVSSVILECLYLTGSKDVKILGDNTPSKIALAIYKGICEYYNITN